MADSLVATADDAPDLPVPAKPQTPLERLRAAPPKTKMLLGGGSAALVALAVAAVLWNRPPDYAVLYSNLGDKDGGAVVGALSQMNVPYRTEGNGVIYVPREKVADLRMRLASQGVVHGGNIGFELMDGQKLGATQFQEQMSYQRALAGELERSIQTVNGVQSARVLIAIPKPSVFVREELKPTASVMVTLMPGRSLDETQVAGIAGLVASAVPELSARDVKIVDQTGKVLQRPEDNTSTLNRHQLEYVNRIEEQTIKRINDILEPIVGPDNFRVQVTADIDFNQQEQTAETYKPNQDPKDGTVRSIQTVDASSKTTAEGGVPGSLTNQPAAAPTAPIGQGANPPAAQAAGANAGPTESRKESTINYEVDKQVRVVRMATGSIRRLTAAVVLNHRTLKNPPEGVQPTQALTPQELEQINSLVREAMGFNKERGDSLSVSNVPFSAPDAPVAPELPIWKDPATLALLKEFAPYIALLMLALIVVFGMVRPAIRSLNPPPPDEKDDDVPVPIALNPDGTPAVPGGFEAVVGPDGEELEALPPPPPPKPVPDPKLIEDICVVARNDPKAVANVIKRWINRDA
ncbi:flagellar basal-body MS-ring/collar protein FliF [Derxia gummosa]|uniref:Flagellar M-ring protein n=1 Tax=Derxia gummosa DSM 723 TaxID=1121388 RepID=A0A8B6X5Y1_9BURK|nr:flagellar basal-body MS-ring/collar protein FliF [Derxia gummosa]